MADRVGAWWLTVACANPKCDDFEVAKVIALPHLGEGVFLAPTTAGMLGMETLNLWCGTCKTGSFSLVDSLASHVPIAEAP